MADYDPQSDPLLARFDTIRSEYTTLHADLAADDKLIRGKFGDQFVPDEWSDEGFEPIILPTAHDAVENASDHLLTTPRNYVPPRPQETSKEAAQATAERLRLFLDLFWRRVFEAYGDPVGRGKKHLVKGRVCFKKTLDWDAIPDPPDDPGDLNAWKRWRRAVEKVGRQKFLWKFDLLSPLHVFEDPENPWNPNFVYEARRVPVHALEHAYPNARAVVGANPNTEVEYVEYYSKPHGDDSGKWCVWIERERVHNEANPYSVLVDGVYDGYCPYLIGDPGWGWAGMEDGKARPEERFVSLIQPLRSLIIAESRQMTTVEAWLRSNVWKMLIATNFADTKQFSVGPGSVVFKRDDQTLEVLNFGQAPEALWQFLGKVQASADRSTKFGALGGTPQSGVDSATEADQNIRNAAVKLSGPVNTLRRIFQEANRQVLFEIEHVLGVPVTLYGALNSEMSEATVKPRDINGYHYTSVDLVTVDDQAMDDRRFRLSADLYTTLPVSAKWAMERGGIVNPTEEMIERQVEDLQRNPVTQQVALMLMLAGLGPTGQAIQQAIMAQMLAGGLQGGGAGGAGGGSPGGPQPTVGDAGQLTSADNLGNPTAGAVTEGRTNALVDQRAAQYR